MRHMTFVSAALAGCVLFAASASADVVVTEKDAGKTIEVKKGDALVVKLVGHHGSGYYWRLDADLTPELILSGRTTEALDLPGAPEETTFTFDTAAAGTLTFKASNLKTGAPIPTSSDFVCTIDVTP
ncbi:MAG TPA: protease inhibitor I42 family protein [Rhizomicrobium sp.]|nr:protease inhibitor I42 family protein [Rhizomicrobium sp.]